MQTRKTTIKAIVWILAALILLLLIARLAIAPLTRSAIVDWFEQQGLDAQIDDIGFDLGEARAVLTGLAVNDGGTQVLALPRAQIAWSWSALSDRRLRLESIEIDGLDFEVARGADGALMIAGIDLGASGPAPTAETNAPGEAPDWVVELARFEMNDTSLCYRALPKLDYCSELATLAWNGELSYDLARSDSAVVPLAAGGDFRLAGFESRSNSLQRVLASFDRFDFETVSIDTLETIGVAAIRLETLNLFEREDAQQEPFIQQIDRLQVGEVRIERGELLTIAHIEVVGNATRVVKSSAEQFEHNAWLAALGQAPDAPLQEREEASDNGDDPKPADEEPVQTGRLDESSEPEAAETEAPAETAAPSAPRSADDSPPAMAFALDRFSFRTEKPLQYRDLSLDEPFVIGFSATELEILELDSREPDRPSKISYSARLDGRKLVTIEGSASPLAQKPSLDMQGEIENLDLRRLSPFTVDAIGHRIRSGQLDAKIDLTGSEGILDAEIDLKLYKFELLPLSKEDAEKMDSRFGFPLNSSLSLLKDREGNIELKVPVTGDIRSPEFGTGNVLNRALASAITAAVLNYYTPFGLVTAVDGLFSLATALRFEPVVFDAGASDFAARESGDLEKISALMQERPGVHLTLCPYTNTADRLKLFPKSADSAGEELTLDDRQKGRLAELGEARAAAVREALAASDVDVGRLVACAPLHEEGDSPSRVEISI